MIDFARAGAVRPEPGSRGSAPGSAPSGPARPTASGPSTPRSAAAVRARRKRLGRLGDEIARLSAHLQAATYRLLVMIRAFDKEEGWHEEGFPSCARWLSWRTGITPGAAREKVRVARALGDLPRLSEGLRKGRLSYSAARALTRVATRDNERELVEMARHTPASQLERLVAGWRAADRAEDAERERARHASRALWVVPEADGSWAIRGRLDPEVGAVLCRALEAAREALYAGGATEPESSPEARRADALGLVAEAALGDGLGMRPEDAEEAAEGGAQDRAEPESAAGTDTAPESEAEPGTLEAGPEPGTPAPVVGRAGRFQVVVHVSAETLAGSGDEGPTGAAGAGSGDGALAATALGRRESRIEGGPHISAETSRRLACDAGVLRMAHDRAGNVLDVGRKRRTVPPALRRALDRRDGGCRFPGCASRYCDAHHIRHWAAGGETKLANLALLCRRHHRLVHEEGWRMERGAAGKLLLYRPDGRLLPAVPAPPPVPTDPVAAVEREQRGLAIDPWTPTPRWLGEPLDLDWALFTLRGPPRAERETGDPDEAATTPAAPGVSAESPHTRAWAHRPLAGKRVRPVRPLVGRNAPPVGTETKRRPVPHP